MRSLKTAVLLPFLSLYSLNAVAQNPHDAQPERPSVATHAGTVAPGWLEIEAGGEFDRYEDNSHAALVPFNVKIGLSTHTQLHVFPSGVQAPGSNTFGFGDLGLGVKWRLADDLPIIGRVAVLPIIKLATGSTNTGTGTGTYDGTVLLISSNDLNGIALDVNIGYTRRSGDGQAAPREAALWTVSFGGPGIGDLGWVAELYGYPGTSGPAGQVPTVAVLLGPTLAFRPWLVFDLGFIGPIAGPQSYAFYGGVTWNIGHLVP